MPIRTSEVEFESLDSRFTGYLADGSNGARAPGILVVHEGRGFTQHSRDRADMLARLGYVAFAPDYLGGVARSLEHAFELMAPFERDRGRFRAVGSAALDVLRRHAHVDDACLGAIGFCWGGYAVIELACHAPLRAVTGFHPGLSLGPPTNPVALSASVLICVGDRDPFVPKSDIDHFMAAMAGSNVDCQLLLLSGAPHSFSNPEPYLYDTGAAEGVAYDPVADKRAWRAMERLFAEAFEG